MQFAGFKQKNLIIISVDLEKAFDNVHYLWFLKSHSKFGIKKNSFNKVRIVYQKSITNFYLVGTSLASIFSLQLFNRE